MAEFEFAGMTFRGGKLFVVLTALSTACGGLWGAFEFYKDYMDMKEQISSYVAPDLSGFQEQLSVMDQKMMGIEDSVLEARDYTRDIKTDLKSDMDRLEAIVDDIEDIAKGIEAENREQLNENINDVRELIDIADQRFDNKRDALETDTDRKLEALEDSITSRLQRALDNPLAD